MFDDVISHDLCGQNTHFTSSMGQIHPEIHLLTVSKHSKLHIIYYMYLCTDDSDSGEAIGTSFLSSSGIDIGPDTEEL